MASISSRIQFLIGHINIPPEMWDFIYPHGPVLRSHAIKEYMMAGVVRDISHHIADRELAHQVKSAGADMVKFASAHLVNGWEDGDDWCPLIPHWPFPFPHPNYGTVFGPRPEPWFNNFGSVALGPQPEPWFSSFGYAELNPQPLPPKALASALKVLAGFTSLPQVAEQLKAAGAKLEYQLKDVAIGV